MRILFLTYHFAPFNHIGAVRCVKTAKYLAQTGHQVRVITGTGHRLPEGLENEIGEHAVVRVPCPHLDPRRRLANSPGSVQTARPAATSRSRAVLKPFYRAYQTLLWYPDNIAFWKRRLVSAAMAEVRGFKPHLLYASGPPFTPLIAAAELSRRMDVPLVLELRDLWTDNHNYPYPWLRKVLEARLEREALSSASALVTVSEPLAEKLRNRYDAPVHVIPNGFDPLDFQVEPRSFDPSSLNLVYTGSIYPGKQDIEPLFRAMQQSPLPVHVHIFSRNGEIVVGAAVANGVDARVHHYGIVPHREALAAQRGADALLFLPWNDPQQRGVMTGKLFEYLGSRRPVVAVGSPGDSAGRLIVERDVGFVGKDPGEIADCLRSLFKLKQAEGRIADLSPAGGAGFTRQEQVGRLSDLFADVVAGLA